ncbi:glyoxalase/bleomycin resistance/extradiol dioxygenase family protein [Streptomyces sp. NPDC006510]|uniref:glyoxalase/bleomycin resistance/extradiol dioxygenase family protein n=1 Tax=Streptomyces sp. NPDC006510 TaxID=3155600 RepID=UPI0033A0D2D6
MDALHPRLLVSGFADCFRFYDAVLPRLIGAVRASGSESGPYAHWDVDGQGVLVLFDRGAMAAVTGAAGLPAEAPPAQDRSMFVCRVADVDASLALCLAHGAAHVAGACDRPEWGPGLRTAHVRDPDGCLIELQSY